MSKARYRFIRKNNNYYPLIDDRDACEPKTLTANGDRHSNFNTMLNDYIANGLIAISRKDQTQLALLYYVNLLAIRDKETLKKLIQDFDKSLDKALVLTPCDYFELGDETGDRGRDDLKIHRLIKKVRSGKVNLKIFPSNHGMATILSREFNKYGPYDIPELQSISIIVLQHLIDMGAIEKQEVDNMVDTDYYQACSDLFEIIYFQQNPEEEISSVLCSHAKIIDLNDIAALAKQFGVECHFDTKENIELTKKRINEFYKKKLFAKEIHTLLPTREQYQNKTFTPFYNFLWKRLSGSKNINLGSITYACSGHDGFGSASDGVLIDMDNEGGKQNILNSDNLYPVFRISSKQVQIEINKLKNKIKSNKFVTQYLLDHISDLDVLISDRNIFSSKQVNRLSNTLFGDQCEPLWEKLIGKDNEIKKEFVNAFRYASPYEVIDKEYKPCSLLDVLSQMQSNEILNKENLKRILKHHKNTEEIYQIFLILLQAHEQTKLLNQMNFDLIISCFDGMKHINDINLLIATLYEAREADSLNPLSIRLHIESTFKSASYLKKLKLVNMVKYIAPQSHTAALDLRDDLAEMTYDLLYEVNNISYDYNSTTQENLAMAYPLRDEGVALLVHFFIENANFIPNLVGIIRLLAQCSCYNFKTVNSLMEFKNTEIKQLHDVLSIICKDNTFTIDQFNFIVEYFDIFTLFLEHDTLTIDRIDYLLMHSDLIELLIPMIDTLSRSGQLATEKNNNLNFLQIMVEILSHLAGSDEQFSEQNKKEEQSQNICCPENINLFCQTDLLLIHSLFQITHSKLHEKYLTLEMINLIYNATLIGAGNSLHAALSKKIPVLLAHCQSSDFELLITIYLSKVLPALLNSSLLNDDNIKKVTKHILYAQEMESLISISQIAYGSKTINQQELNAVILLAPYHASIIEVLADYHLLTATSKESMSLLRRYLSTLAAYSSDIGLINRILSHFSKNREFLSNFIEHIELVLSHAKTFSHEDIIAANFVSIHMEPFINQSQRFMKTKSLNMGNQNSSSLFKPKGNSPETKERRHHHRHHHNENSRMQGKATSNNHQPQPQRKRSQ